jgi:uncharacterized protein YdeI (YjbR/CyaY-like superfamily)
MKPKFFSSPSALRTWFEEHHNQSQELWVGFCKKNSGKPSITWPEAVDAALCFGWIDGVRKSIDDVRYTIRFTPRKPRSTWSAVNIKRAHELTKMGLMQPAGLQAFQKRQDEKSAIYSYEQRGSAKLTEEYEQRLRANKKAWNFFQAQAPWYQRGASWWVVSAKREDTRVKRLATLIKDSEQGRTIPPLTRAKPK